MSESEADRKMVISIAKALRDAAETMRAAGVSEPRLEASLLLSHTIGRDRAFLIAHDDQTLSPGQLQTLAALVSRRSAGEPLQYITGHQAFFNLDFDVTPDVLIPRPESEAIVEAALELLRPNLTARFADIGTGSGCLAVSILQELPAARAIATDISAAALEVARANAARHRVTPRLQLIQSDLFAKVPAKEEFHLIVSNPPYVPDHSLKSLSREVRHEPRSALAAGPDGLEIIRRLLREAPEHLVARGQLVFEFGFGQYELLTALIDHQVWEVRDVRNDLQGIPRTMVLGKK
jgi:release factor glutamine methyltransferase